MPIYLGFAVLGAFEKQAPGRPASVQLGALITISLPGLSPRSKRKKPVLGQRLAFKKQVTSMNSTLKPPIWLRHTGQRIPGFDKMHAVHKQYQYR